MYICMYACMYVYTYVRRYVYTYICMYVCLTEVSEFVMGRPSSDPSLAVCSLILMCVNLVLTLIITLA